MAGTAASAAPQVVPHQGVNAGARLDALPIAGFHWRVLGLISAGAFIDAFDIYLMAGVMAAMLKDGFSTLALNAVFVSTTFLGMLIGSGAAGWLGDRKGRRYSYQTNLAIFGLASLAACFAPSMPVLIGLRFLMGLGLGAELVVAAGALCEFIPPSHRGRWTAMMSIAIGAGLPAASLLGYLMIPIWGWRSLFGFAAAAALVVWVMRKQLPESPRWLESVGRLQEAEAVLAKIEAEVAAEQGPLVAVPRAAVPRLPAVPFSALFSRAMIGRTVAACLTIVAVNISVYGFVAWLPSFLVRQGMTMVQSLGFTTLMSFGAIAGSFIGMLVSDRIPRRIGLICACAAIAVLGAVYPTMRETVATAVTGFALIASIYTMTTLGQYAYVPELFPTELRLRGAGVASMCGRAAAISTPYLAVGLFKALGLPGVIGMVCTALAALVVAILLVRVETGGRSLESVSSLQGT